MSIFGKPKKSPPPGDMTSPRESSAPVSSRRTVISQGTVIKGEINSNDALLVDGQVEGHMTVKNMITVGKDGRITADVTATALEIHGKIIGDVVATDRVSIERSGSVEGNIRSPKLMISEGAHFKGNIDMSQKSSTAPPASPTPAGGEKKKFELRGSGQGAVATDH